MTGDVYEKFEPVPWHMKALRTKPPNLGIHLPWFTKKEDLTPDEVYYFENAPQRPHPQRGPGWTYRPE